MALGGDYLKELKERAKESHVHREFQLIGLEAADILNDRKHKALYIKMAKEHGHEVLRLAKEIADKKNIKNPGAYFMTVISELRKKPKAEVYRSKPRSPAKKKNAE